MARRSDGESVLHRHLRVLETFTAWHPFRTLSEIAREADLTVSTTHRLVRELEREGLLERLPDLRYRLGVRLWEFASRTPGAVGLREIARPWLSAVHARVRQHAQLGVRSGHDVLFIDRMSTPEATLNATLLGGRIPLYASSIGQVLLAHADDRLLSAVLAEPLRIYNEHSLRTPEQVRAAVRQARTDGYAVTEGLIHAESRGIAVPIAGPDGTIYAGLGLVVPNDAGPTLPYVELLLRASAGIARDLADAYRADGEDGRSGIRPLVSSSRRSLEFLEHLDDPR